MLGEIPRLTNIELFKNEKQQLKLNVLSLALVSQSMCSAASAERILYSIRVFMKAGLWKGQWYWLGTGPFTLHSKKENMGNQMRALRL